MADDDAVVLAERAADLARWAAARETNLILAEEIRRDRPSDLRAVELAEARVRKIDPLGLPPRCGTCSRRLPMIQRADGFHPKHHPALGA